MKEKDVLTTTYMSEPTRFADAVNTGVFDGRQVVSPEQIKEIDTTSNFVLKRRKTKGIDAGQQYRDILKTVAYNTNFCIVGIENQSDIHYVFPVRNMLYDAAAYKKQWNAIKKEHREKRDLTGAEYISGFSKEDYLQAVVTLVVYFGSEPWNGAKDLHSLIDWTGMPEELKEVVPNYSIHLLELNKYENLDDFKSDLKTVCRFLQNSEDAKKLETMLEEHRDEFEDMAEDTYDLIGAFGNMEPIINMKEEAKKKDGGYNMCKGMEDWLKQKEKEGLEQGIKALIETCKEFGLSREEAVNRVKDKCALADSDVEKYFMRYWK